MTDNELNQWLYENVMEGCKGYDLAEHEDCSCVIHQVPNYTESLDAVRAVEEKVIEKVGVARLGDNLAVVFRQYEPNSLIREFTIPFSHPRYRAEACKLAWEALNQTEQESDAISPTEAQK